MTALARRLPAAPEPDPDAFRWNGLPGHVESYFWRANDPARPRALWVKATVLAPVDGPAVAEAWFIWFDGERGIARAHKQTVPIAQACFGDREIRAGDWRWERGPSGRLAGAVSGRFRAALDLRWEAPRHRLAAPLSLYRWRALRQGPLPKLKLNTPHPWLRFSGALELDGERIALDGWEGMQGHNWGRQHPFAYAWGQCLFPGGAGRPPAMVEAFTGRIQLAGKTTPAFSAMEVRRGGEVLRFDRLVDFWRQRAEVGPDHWSLALSGADGEARLVMDASRAPSVCLGYPNPDGILNYCINTKLARVLLQVQPRRGPAFELRSEHGGALEFLRREPDPRFAEVI